MSEKMIIVVAPSGAGKSSFVDRITQELPVLKDTVTFTTRPARAGEVDGNPYHFVTEERFRQLVDQGFFAEWAKVHSNLYGTPLHQIHDAWREKRAIIMDVDVQGAQTFKKRFPGAKTIFILPPSLEELRRRITGRDRKLPADFELRLQNAEKEIALAPTFDYQVVNDEFERSYQEFKKIVEEVLAAE